MEETQSAITELLQGLNPESHDIYVCGPQAMIELVSTTAIKSGFSADQVYYEYFGLTDHATSRAHSEGGYQVTIQSTGQEFTVEPGRSLLQACLEAGVEIDYSCEQGVCGACMTKVISGDLQHEDVYLSSKEKNDGKLIMPCVSSCKSAKLVLDI
nr:2Fe-2S iron-sulfur cluster binding domain-containing protein [Klebsiella michiganensis]